MGINTLSLHPLYPRSEHERISQRDSLVIQKEPEIPLFMSLSVEERRLTKSEGLNPDGITNGIEG